jgi:hypothetical protein
MIDPIIPSGDSSAPAQNTVLHLHASGMMLALVMLQLWQAGVGVLLIRKP